MERGAIVGKEYTMVQMGGAAVRARDTFLIFFCA